MEAETFTLEITPENCGSPTSANACFQLTLDIGDCAPTFCSGPNSPGISVGGVGLSWQGYQQAWYQATPNMGYYNPYYYNYYGAVHGASPGSSPLPPAPLLPTPVTSQASIPTNKQESKSKSSLKRVPTPHPRRPASAAVSLLPSSRPKPQANGTFSSGQKKHDPNIKESNKAAGVPYLQKPNLPLSERMNRLSLPSKSSLVGDDGKKISIYSEIVGRPLWSGNFSGANSPAQTSVPVKPTKQSTENHFKSNSVASKTRSNSSEKHPPAAVGENSTAPAPPKGSVAGKSNTTNTAPPPASCTSPIVQYVSYNYRPLVVQSPTCGNRAAVFDTSSTSGVFLPSSSSSTRFRTTSTLETICPFNSD